MGAQTGDAEAERLYLLSETERSTSDEEAVQRTLNELRQFGPASPWLEQALLSAGNMYLLKRDYDRAIDYFRELQQRFPNGTRASYAHWKAAWLTFRQGRTDEARQGFEDQIALYPDSAEIPAALYWRARLAEEEGNPAMARAFYQKLSDRFRNYYYAEFGRQRLKGLPSASQPPRKQAPPNHHRTTRCSTTLRRCQPLGKLPPADPPDDNLRVARARLLSNGGLADMAVRELQAAASQEGGSWAPPEMARVYQDGGRYDRGIEIMKRSTPNYFAVDIPDLPRPYWEALFPKAYWTDLRKYSVLNGLDPYLVASLIRQESEFNALALSRANAVGLMQLLPKTGKTVAKQVKLKGYSAPATLHASREPRTRHALLQRDGRQVQRTVRVRAGRLQRRQRPRRRLAGTRPLPRSAGVRRVHPLHRNPRIRASHPAQRECIPAALRNAVADRQDTFVRNLNMNLSS